MSLLGRQLEVGIAAEATRGTGLTTAHRWMRNVSGNIVERALHAVDDTTRGKLEDGIGRRVAQKYIEGELNGIAHADAIGYIFANLYGICVTTTPLAPARQHVMTLKQNSQHQSLTIFAKDGATQQKIYSGCMVNTLKLTIALEDYVRFNATFIGGLAATNADTPTYSTEYDFIARDVVIKIASSQAGLSGATALKVKGMELSWDAGLIREHVVGQREPNDVYNGQMKIEGSFNMTFLDEVYKNYYLGDTPVYMSITITGEAVIATGHFPMIQLVLNKVQFMDWNRDGGNAELVNQPLKFQAFFNETDGIQSTLTLKNATTTYPNIPTS